MKMASSCTSLFKVMTFWSQDSSTTSCSSAVLAGLQATTNCWLSPLSHHYCSSQGNWQLSTSTPFMQSYFHIQSRLSSTRVTYLEMWEEYMSTSRTWRRSQPTLFQVSNDTIKRYIGSLLFNINMFDSELVFRDMESKEIFVFDRNGIWSEEALTHKLLYWLVRNSISTCTSIWVSLQ